jgi:hypothetical protein
MMVFSTAEVTFPSITICPAFESAYKTEILTKYVANGRNLTLDLFRRDFNYPNVSSLSGLCLIIKMII